MFQNDNNSSYRLAVLHVAQCSWDISLVLPLVLVALVDMLVQEPINALSVHTHYLTHFPTNKE